MMKLSMNDVTRSLELYEAVVSLQEKMKKNEKDIIFAKEPILRRKDRVEKVVVAFGSFDPLTVVHSMMLQKALQTIKEKYKTIDELLITVSTQHIEKQPDYRKNATIYDRIQSMECYATCLGNCSLAIANIPRFVELAEIIQKKYVKAEIYFLAGTDVLEKIGASWCYDNSAEKMEQACEKLFKHRFIVANRNKTADDGKKENITAEKVIEANPVLKKYANNILPINFKEDEEVHGVKVLDISSTMVREKRKTGQKITGLTANGIEEFLEMIELYLNNNHYEATVCARQIFADYAREKGLVIEDYIHALMTYLRGLTDSKFREMTIEKYKKRDFGMIELMVNSK